MGRPQLSIQDIVPTREILFDGPARGQQSTLGEALQALIGKSGRAAGASTPAGRLLGPESPGRVMIVRDPLRLAAARLAAEYVWRAEAWAGDVDPGLVTDLERVHQRILEHIHDLLAKAEGAEDLR
jgi:hypothetical protein